MASDGNEAETEPQPWDPDTDPDGYTLDDIRPKDFYLETLINYIIGPFDQAADAKFGLTLQSNGIVVSGLVISRKAWIDATIAAIPPTELANAVRSAFEDFNATQLEHLKARDEADLPGAPRRFIHMRDVRISAGSQTSELPLWRGALADVTGWSLGSWNPPND